MRREEEKQTYADRWVDTATYDLRQSFPCSEATVSRRCWVRSHLSSSLLQRHFSETAACYKGHQEKSYEGLSPCSMKSLQEFFGRRGGVDVDSPPKIR